jgi:hypothetical protein
MYIERTNCTDYLLFVVKMKYILINKIKRKRCNTCYKKNLYLITWSLYNDLSGFQLLSL